MKQFLEKQEFPLEEFDVNMFWRLIEKVRVELVVEVVFVFLNRIVSLGDSFDPFFYLGFEVYNCKQVKLNISKLEIGSI